MRDYIHVGSNVTVTDLTNLEKKREKLELTVDMQYQVAGFAAPHDADIDRGTEFWSGGNCAGGSRAPY